MVGEEIQIGLIGAVVTSDEKADGYYLIQWTGTPYTDQDTGGLLCDGKYLNPVGGAPKWYTHSEDFASIDLKHVVLADVIMEEISDSNQLPNSCNKREAKSKEAKRISKCSNDFIFNEIRRRDQLEDPEFDDN